MNKKMNVLKVGFALAVGVMVTGCASVGSVANQIVNNSEKAGVIYGFAGVTKTPVSEVCAAVNNKDYRCKNQSEYETVIVYSSFGFAEGAKGVTALIKKDFPNIEVLKEALKNNYATGNKNAPYAKARVIPGQFGEILEVVSTHGDGKCYWSGMPRTGGTVCPAYNWDYRKDNQAGLPLR